MSCDSLQAGLHRGGLRDILWSAYWDQLNGTQPRSLHCSYLIPKSRRQELLFTVHMSIQTVLKSKTMKSLIYSELIGISTYILRINWDLKTKRDWRETDNMGSWGGTMAWSPTGDGFQSGRPAVRPKAISEKLMKTEPVKVFSLLLSFSLHIKLFLNSVQSQRESFPETVNFHLTQDKYMKRNEEVFFDFFFTLHSYFLPFFC